ncbi:hypothetical protein F5Y04DRAFT_289884 [Hypomontagnella monticulosa]|nr:hypothetical protein F5Y04DRAFT_289884 [Hypomontagnella monticulosa]
MADPMSLIPFTLKLAVNVANSFTEYLRGVENAPKVVKSIILEVKVLRSIVETLELIHGENGPIDKTGLTESLSRCQTTLQELEELITPDHVDDLDSQGQTPSKLRVSRTSFSGGSKSTPQPYDQPGSDVEKSATSLVAAQYDSRQSANSPVTPTRSPSRKHGPMSLMERFAWPLNKQRKAEDLLKRLESHKTQISLAVQADTALNLKSISQSVVEIEASLNDNEKRGLLMWLKPKHDMYNFHSEQRIKQEDETCDWMVNSLGWRQFLNGGSTGLGSYRRFVWIFGIPGAGKTVLASFLIDNIAKRCKATGYSYYYCFHEWAEDATIPFLRWIIVDLSRQIGRFVPKELEELNNERIFDIDRLVTCFLAISRQIARNHGRVYIVVDAIDESNKPRDRFLDVLVKIGTDPAFEHVSLLITSRDESDIRAKMDEAEAIYTQKQECLTTARGLDYDVADTKSYTGVTMSNGEVMKAIETYVKKQFEKNDKFDDWPQDFKKQVEEELARNARGMFRWVACQIDIIQRKYLNQGSVLEALKNLPHTLFDTYARILSSIDPDQRAFARTALALICSNSTSSIKSAEVLVRASLHNVPLGSMHTYDVKTLRDILGCLIKVTDLRRPPHTNYKRDEEGRHQKVSISHYTVKEFLFAPSSDGKPRPAGDFALSDIDIRVLEMEVVFNGLQQWGRDRRLPSQQRWPSRYEEHCLDTSEQALRPERRNIIVNNQNVLDAVVPCLRPDSPHLTAIGNATTRKRFPNWRQLTTFDNAVSPPESSKASQEQTSILASMVLLDWPELARKYLRSPKFKNLLPEVKRYVWKNKFYIDPTTGDSLPASSAISRDEQITLLRLCVAWKRIEFIKLFLAAGAKPTDEKDIIYVALQDPYGFGKDLDDGTPTGEILKVLLESGANPNPHGYTYTPLQYAVRHLEEGWVRSLLLEGRDPNAKGDPEGEHPYGGEAKKWHDQHPLRICKTATISWEITHDLEEQLQRARDQITLLLVQYGARDEPEVITVE